LNAPVNGSASSLAPEISHFLQRNDLPDPTKINIPKNAIVIPSGDIGYSESARTVFGRIAPTLEIFLRGDRVVELKDYGTGIGLEIISDQAFRSRVEQYGEIYAVRTGNHGKAVLDPNARVSLDVAKVWLASVERSILKKIQTVQAAPVLVARADNSLIVLPKGYDEASGILVTGGTAPEEISTGEAVTLLLDAHSEWNFAAPADKSRALAMLLTPALRFGGFLHCHIPLFVVEADDSQAGKGYKTELDQAVYREEASVITQKSGGVGGFDESLSQAMLTAKPFIQFDNVRGKIGSPFFEALLTCSLGNTVPARVPHKGEIQVDPARFVFHLTSNGFESTRDLANRSCIVRIRKRRGYKFQEFPEGGLIEHVRANQGKYLGAVHAIVASWHAQGRQRTPDLRGEGRFRQWAQTLDWIVQHICGLPPLMDGHERAQERASNPALTWLRQLVLIIEQTGELGRELSASRLCEVSKDNGLAIPGIAEDVEDNKRNQGVGRIMARLFGQTDTLELDDFKVEKSERSESRTDGQGFYQMKVYEFSRQ
jgi:hypothetical protein